MNVVSLEVPLKEYDKLIIDRAYAISPNNHDVLVLETQYHPELKSKLIQVDPLYSAQKN